MLNIENQRQQLKELVARYRQNRHEYTHTDSNYNETELRPGYPTAVYEQRGTGLKAAPKPCKVKLRSET